MNTPTAPSGPFESLPLTWADTDPGPLGWCHQCVIDALTPQAANGHLSPVVPRRGAVLIGRLHTEQHPLSSGPIVGVITVALCVPHLRPGRVSRLATS